MTAPVTQDNRAAEIRTVAAAICKSRTCEGMNCCQWPAQFGRLDCPVMRGGYDDAARAAIAAVSALQHTAPTPEQFARAIFCPGYSPTNPCERGCSCDDHYASVLELISRPVIADHRTEK